MVFSLANDGLQSFRLDVFESPEPCGLNAAIGGETLVAKEDAYTFALDDNLQALGQWRTVCLSEEVLLMLSFESVQGLEVEGVDLTIRVRRKCFPIVQCFGSRACCV